VTRLTSDLAPRRGTTRGIAALAWRRTSRTCGTRLLPATVNDGVGPRRLRDRVRPQLLQRTGEGAASTPVTLSLTHRPSVGEPCCRAAPPRRRIKSRPSRAEGRQQWGSRAGPGRVRCRWTWSGSPSAARLGNKNPVPTLVPFFEIKAVVLLKVLVFLFAG
jgi:hypothetical protein